ncbi:MAG: S8 family serine peptidase [Tahibacter sp.]
MSTAHRIALTLAIAALVSTGAFGADFARLTPEQLVEAKAHGATVVHDYGSFAWVRDSGKGLSTEETFSLDLGGRRFDPLAESAANVRVYDSGKALRMVQFDGPTRQQWLQTLAAEGITPVQYIAPFSYVVWADDAALARGKQQESVRWVGDFQPQYKAANMLNGLARNEVKWRAMLYRGAAVSDSALRASGAGVGARSIIDRQFEIVEIQANAQSLEQLAKMPGVYALEPVPRDGGLRAELANQITANNLNGSNLPVPGYLTWLSGLGVNGNGVVIAAVDGGIFDTHPDLVGRMLPCVGDTCGGSATNAHGTHTAAIMAGDGSSGVNDANGFRRGLGMAPGAKLVEQVYSPTFQQAGGMLKLMRQSNDNGASLSGNSWGPAGSPLGYDADTRQVDVGTRDTKPDIAGDQPLTYVLSFMNGNGGTSTQGTPDEAKNVITVGSTKGQTSAGAVIAAFDDVSSNSAHGPALDGRRIPHLVTPGCYVDSAASATGYQTMCGTSMASPQVSGSVALFIDKYRATHAGSSPSTALIKAALVASSKDLVGKLDASGGTLGHRPDSKQGWGRLRADWMLNPAASVLYYDQGTQVFDNTGESWNRTFASANATLPMQLVLVYTDAPGHGLGGSTPAWNNDLDLEVTAGSTIYHGNVFAANGFSASGGVADNKNNIESVVLDAATVSAAGSLNVRVVASNLTSDGLPNSGDATDQDFALVCVNCLSQPDYTVSTDAAPQSICTSTTTSTSWPIAIGSNLGYVDAVNLSLIGIPSGASGSVLPAQVTPPGSSTASLSALNAVTPGSYTFQLQTSSTSGIKQRDLKLIAANALPAAATLSAPANNAMNVALRPSFAWSASVQSAQYLVEVASDAAFANIVFSSTTAATSAQPTADLASSSTYFWRVRPSNACGADPAPVAFQFSTVAAPGDCSLGTTAHTVLTDDVENGANGWTAAAGSGATTWAISTTRPFGGTGHAWLAQDIATVSDQRLTSVDIALPTGQNPLSLQFQSDQTMEPATNGCWDGGFLEISTNAGSSFAAIPAAAMLTDPYNGPLGSGNPAAPAPAWCGDPQAYLKSVVDLSAYAGLSVRLRFRMTTDTSTGRLPNGWYVDNIRVQSCAPPAPDSIFANGFQ